MKMSKRTKSSAKGLAAHWKKRRNVHPESFRQKHQLGVAHTTKLSLDLGKRGAAQLKPQNRTSRGKKFLRQPLFISQFSDLRADDIAQPFYFPCHAPKMELDIRAYP